MYKLDFSQFGNQSALAASLLSLGGMGWNRIDISRRAERVLLRKETKIWEHLQHPANPRNGLGRD